MRIIYFLNKTFMIFKFSNDHFFTIWLYFDGSWYIVQTINKKNYEIDLSICWRSVISQDLYFDKNLDVIIDLMLAVFKGRDIEKAMNKSSKISLRMVW